MPNDPTKCPDFLRSTSVVSAQPTRRFQHDCQIGLNGYTVRFQFGSCPETCGRGSLFVVGASAPLKMKQTLSNDGGIDMVIKTDTSKSALILARPGRLRDSLGALLTSIPQIQQVDSTDDTAAVLDKFANPPPNLILMDTNLAPNGLSLTLRRIKDRWPQARCLILADDVRQQYIARNAGADSALLKGYPTAQLFATIERLLRLSR